MEFQRNQQAGTIVVVRIRARRNSRKVLPLSDVVPSSSQDDIVVGGAAKHMKLTMDVAALIRTTQMNMMRRNAKLMNVFNAT